MPAHRKAMAEEGRIGEECTGRNDAEEHASAQCKRTRRVRRGGATFETRARSEENTLSAKWRMVARKNAYSGTCSSARAGVMPNFVREGSARGCSNALTHEGPVRLLEVLRIGGGQSACSGSDGTRGVQDGCAQ